MTRWILLGLDDDEVDVISRIPRETAPGDVVVYHPDPEALVLQLAELAELTRAESPPDLHAEDVVVLGTGDRGTAWAEMCRRVGARLIDPREMAGTADEGDSAGTNGADERAASRDGDRGDAQPTETLGGIEGRSARSGSGGGAEVATEGRHDMKSPTPEIFADPEATFRWALRSAGCQEAVLWWDGNAGIWIPWISARPLGEAVEGDPVFSAPPEGWELTTRWGRFVITGIRDGAERLHPDMLRRFAEDLALRDLMRWREAAARLDALRPASREADLLAWGPWLEEALPVFAPSAALLWIEQGDAWRLARAWGDGVGLAGELRLPRTLFEATFPATTPWRDWEVVGGLKLLFIPSSEHTRWPLDLARLARSATAGDPA